MTEAIRSAISISPKSRAAKRSDRPALDKALAAARVRQVVAKVDRLPCAANQNPPKSRTLRLSGTAMPRTCSSAGQAIVVALTRLEP